MAEDVSALQQALVDELKSKGLIQSACVEAAFRAVPRHLFVPDAPLDQVYRDTVIVTKKLDGVPVSSCSQPAMVAVMLEQLGLEPGHRVLEIGAGTGYNAALMAQIVGNAGQVITMDIDEDLIASAREHLSAAGFDRVQVVCADGWQGYPEAAPYDRIILTVGVWDVSPAWSQQLKSGGRLLMPLAIKAGAQKSVAFEQANGYLVSRSLKECGFMMMRGESTPDIQPKTIPLGPEPGLALGLSEPRAVDRDAVYGWLTGPARDWPAGVHVTLHELWSGVNLWLILHDEGDDCSLTAWGEMAERGIVPCLVGDTAAEKWCATGGVLTDQGLALLTRLPDPSPSLSRLREQASFDLYVRSYGPDDTPTQRLIERVKAWDSAGRPSSTGLRIRAYPPELKYNPLPGEFVVVRPWTQLVLNWS